jgi:hypothetical protein
MRLALVDNHLDIRAFNWISTTTTPTIARDPYKAIPQLDTRLFSFSTIYTCRSLRSSLTYVLDLCSGQQT